MTKVAAVILAGTVAEAQRQARAALGKGADLAEVRFDETRDLTPPAIRTIASAVGPRAIATLRSPGSGGRPGDDRAWRALQVEICSRRFAYVDIEIEPDVGEARELARLASRNGSQVIASHHFAEPVDASRAEDRLAACAALGDVAKVAVPVDDLDAAVQLLDVARRHVARKERIVLIGMGVAGTITRALAADVGEEIQYTSWGRPAASGQLPFAAAKRLRGGEPTILGVVGHPLGHSLSPAIHEAALESLQVPGVYLPFDVAPDSLEALFDAVDSLRIRGFNVTIPHKETILESLDELDGDAQRLGAVNTVVVREGWTEGHNTDVVGFRLSLRSLGLRMGGRRALVVGAGGAAKAVVDVLLREGATVQITNRTPARAAALAASFDEPAEALPREALERGGPWDLLVNATPIGMNGHPGGLPVPEPVVAKAAFVYDLVYNPPVTPLLSAAARLGKPRTSGLEMLLLQAAKSFELWTGRAPPIEAMRRAAKEALR